MVRTASRPDCTQARLHPKRRSSSDCTQHAGSLCLARHSGDSSQSYSGQPTTPQPAHSATQHTTLKVWRHRQTAAGGIIPPVAARPLMLVIHSFSILQCSYHHAITHAYGEQALTTITSGSHSHFSHSTRLAFIYARRRSLTRACWHASTLTAQLCWNCFTSIFILTPNCH